MFRHIALAAVLIATPCVAQSIQTEAAPEAPLAREADRALRSEDGFVFASDECGASRFAHLIGQDFTVLQASMPGDPHVLGRTGLVSTLEYQPGRLNVVLDGAGRIISIGCS